MSEPARIDIIQGDEKMRKRKKSYTIEFVCVEDRTEEIVRTLARREIEKVLAKHGAISDNLDEVLHKHITASRGNIK